MTDNDRALSRVDRMAAPAAVMAIVGFVLLFVGSVATGDKNMALKSYLYGYMFWACLTFGCLGLSLLTHALKNRWGIPMIRLFEAGGGWQSLILMGLLFLPIPIFGLGSLYKWADPAVVQADEVLQFKAPYLNPGFFWLRAILYFAVFAAWAYLNSASLRRQEASGNPREADWRASFSAGGMVVFVLVMTFLVTDWVMSLEPHWFSTLYGFLFVTGQVLAALALVAVIFGTQYRKRPYHNWVDGKLSKDLGNLMLAGTMFWAYLSVSQFIIIWNGNLPEFTGYFLHRLEGNWNLIGAILIVFHFFVPFLLLLSPKMKREPSLLAVVGVWLLLMRAIDLMYTIVPFYQESFMPSAMHLLSHVGALLAVGGIWLANFAFQLRRAPLIPENMIATREEVQHA